MFKKLLLASALGLVFMPLAAVAQIKIGVTLSTTGPAASLGIPEKNAFAIMPREIAGKKIEYIVLDDASDPVAAVKNARKFVSEDKVDVLLGSSITPNSLAMVDVAAEAETPMIAMAASARIVDPVDAKRAWVFKTPQNDAQMATAIVEPGKAAALRQRPDQRQEQRHPHRNQRQRAAQAERCGGAGGGHAPVPSCCSANSA